MVDIINADYLKWIAPQQYDLIVMNPPFKLGSEMIMKAVTELKDGGTLAFIMQSTWRGYKGRSTIIYPKLATMGAFKTIHTLTSDEISSMFNVRVGVDLVIFQKGATPTLVDVRNKDSETYTYNQEEFPLSVPFIHPDIYRTLFDDENGITAIPGYGRAENKGQPFTFKPFYMEKEITVGITAAKQILMQRAKTCYDGRGAGHKAKVEHDDKGSTVIDKFARMLPLVKQSRQKEFTEIMQNRKIPTAAHTGGGASTTLPPFNKDWFEEESLEQWLTN